MERQVPHPIDRERSLTSPGREEVEALRRQLQGVGLAPDRILHSGYRRARETAEILAPLGGSSPREHSAMTPEDDPDILVAELERFGGTTLIVSHLPFLPNLCEELLDTSSDLPVLRQGRRCCWNRWRCLGDEEDGVWSGRSTRANPVTARESSIPFPFWDRRPTR